MRIVFVSCCKLQSVADQVIWKYIGDEHPDLLLLLGDNVYLNNDFHVTARALQQDLAERYCLQLKEPHFKALLDTLGTRRVMATWDDHDSLGNDRHGLDSDPALVDVARAEFHRAFPYSANHPEIYCRRDFGDVTVLMLDVRSYRTRPRDDESGDAVLGVAQWQWLEAQLRARQRFTVVASGTCYKRYKWMFQSEAWIDYPAAAGRLRQLIGHQPGVLFVSGDIHKNVLGNPDGIIEAVSSGVARNYCANYGVADFHGNRLTLRLENLDDGERIVRDVDLSDWRL